MRFASLFSGLLTLATPAAATIWGLNCTPSSPDCNTPADLVAVAGTLEAQIVRVRVSLPHPICPTAKATWGPSWMGCTIAQADVDPLTDANTTCPGYDIKLADVSSFPDPGGTPYDVSSDVLPINTKVMCKSGSTITVNNNVVQYISANSNYKVINTVSSPPATYQALSNAGIAVDLTIFAAASPGGAADAAEIGDAPYSTVAGAPYSPSASYQGDLGYLLDVQIFGGLMPFPQLITVGNEEDGGGTATCGSHTVSLPVPMGFTCLFTPTYNGDSGYDGSGTPTWYVHKLQDTVAFAHTHSPPIPVGDSGTTLFGLELAYWNDLFNTCGSDSCRKTADAFQQWGFAKSGRQAGISNALPTWCNPAGAPGLSTGMLNHAARAQAIWAADQTIGVDYVNVHYYDDPWIGFTGAMSWVRAQAGGLPLMANEIGSYHSTVVNTVGIMAGAQQLGFVYGDWWNQEGASGQTFAMALTNPDGTLRDSGTAWLAYRGALDSLGHVRIHPNVMTGPGPVGPLCAGE